MGEMAHDEKTHDEGDHTGEHDETHGDYIDEIDKENPHMNIQPNH